MKTGRRLFCAAMLWFFSSTLGAGAPQTPTVRVAIVRDVEELTLSVGGTYEIAAVSGEKKLHRGRHLAACKVTATSQGIRIHQTVFETASLRISARKKAAIVLNRRPYRGDIIIRRTPGGLLTAVNVLDIESYVKGVLVREISHKWPIDAIKAQAVATRTYALYQKEICKNRDYDLTADTSSQVYGGFSSEKSKTNRAVNFTAGEALLYRGKVFPAYFHATCGGSTERASELWKIDIEPLAGGRLCSFCTSSPHYYWTASVDFKNIRKKLGRLYTLKGELKNILVAERNPSGRVRSVELKDDQGASMVVSAKDFRQAQGPDVVRSANFTIAVEGPKVIFAGKGWGHGVGLCQWGAFGMSRKGYSYREILEFYYPGASIEKIY
ncbi:MAG: SpoIID/LytB domain-containing protein [Candidatus Omnitrophica bacterium]|nr:SpoIID/LytB domain-containing protein [Candidatus Omnitrophota bacterium]MDD5574253.1 SpoIID/LytB domain-containing protein [Candidatus Omnitrophota bacterium]